MDIREKLCEYYGDNLLFADGYDDAIIGVCGGFDSGRVAYSVPKMIEIAAKDLSVDHDEAMDGLSTILLEHMLENAHLFMWRPCRYASSICRTISLGA